MAPKTSYTLLEPKITSELNPVGQSLSFSTNQPLSFYASTTFIWGVFFVAIVTFAFVRFVLASGLRMQGTPTSISKSNEIFKTVTLGLLGVFSLFLILYTFNKDLLIGDVGLGELKVVGGGGASAGAGATGRYEAPTTPTTPRETGSGSGYDAIKQDPIIRQQLKSLPSNGISVNKAVCSSPTQRGCTTVGGWPPSTFSMLTELRSNCKGSIQVTGGTEAGHSSHGPGLSPVDIALNDETLNSCIRGFPVAANPGFCYAAFRNFGYVFCDERSADRHWHAFKG